MEASVTGWIWAGIGLAATAAVGFFSPYIIAGLSQAVRPVVKGAVKGYLVVEAGCSDLVNEAQADLTN
jgi:hypothetical protein